MTARVATIPFSIFAIQKVTIHLDSIEKPLRCVMPSASSLLRSTSIYADLCWDCLLKKHFAHPEGRSLRRNLSSTPLRKRTNSQNAGQVRRLHNGRALRQEVTKVATATVLGGIPPDLVQVPIRERLAKWQEENGNPMSDLLGLDTAFGIRNVVADTYGDRKKPRSQDPENDAEEDELPPAEYDQEISQYGGIHIQMGDLVELRYTPPSICQ
jgi:hypothetical protein